MSELQANPGTGVLIVWTDIPREIETEFNAWYDHEHLPDRILRMPGFLRGRRYQSVSATAGAPKYLTYYNLQDTAFMMSPAHTTLRRERPARDRLFVPKFLNTIKGICDVVGRAGTSGAEHLLLLPVTALAGSEARLAQYLCSAVLPAIAAGGSAAATYAYRNAEVTQASSAKDDRKGDRYVDALIVVEADSEAGIAAALERIDMRQLARAGGAPQYVNEPCVLRLRCDLHAPTGGIRA